MFATTVQAELNVTLYICENCLQDILTNAAISCRMLFSSGRRKAMLTTITKEILTKTFSGKWFVLLNLSDSGNEGKVEGLPRYRRPGIKAVRYIEENGILQMVRESLWRRRRTAGHNMVFR